MQMKEKIKLIRQASGLTQIEFAKEAGCAQQTLSNWENGHRAPTYASLIKLNDMAIKYKAKVKFL